MKNAVRKVALLCGSRLRLVGLNNARTLNTNHGQNLVVDLGYLRTKDDLKLAACFDNLNYTLDMLDNILICKGAILEHKTKAREAMAHIADVLFSADVFENLGSSLLWVHLLSSL